MQACRKDTVLCSPDPEYREKVDLVLHTLQNLEPLDLFFFVDELAKGWVSVHLLFGGAEHLLQKHARSPVRHMSFLTEFEDTFYLKQVLRVVQGGAPGRS
jgi:hypothetical protein